MWSTADEKTVLQQILAAKRAHILSKLDGLDDEAARHPITPSLTNLLGILKHLTGVELRICDTFGWEREPWPPEAEDELRFGGDMWARADESIEDIVNTYRGACAAVDALVAELDLDTTGEWMGHMASLRAMLVGMISETAHHAGHADVVRELIDGSTGGPTLPVAGGGLGAAYFETVRARMRGEVGPEAWDKFRTPELDKTIRRYRAARATRRKPDS